MNGSPVEHNVLDRPRRRRLGIVIAAARGVPETVPPVLGFLGHHLYAVVFVVALIDATGIPFPGRLLIVTVGALASPDASVIALVLAAAAGAVTGDHLVYGVGRLGGEPARAWYCRWTLAGEGCVSRARERFARYGPAAIMLGRFAFSVRLIVALLAGSGAMSYGRFLTFDALGAVGWAAALVLLGRLLGARAVPVLDSYGGVGAMVAVGATGLLGLAAYRLWQRRRQRAAPAAG